MSKILMRRFDLPGIGEVLIERRQNGSVRVADPDGDNVQTITPSEAEEAAFKVLSYAEDDPLPPLHARRLALYVMGQRSGWTELSSASLGRDAATEPGERHSPCPPAGSAPSVPLSPASSLSQEKTSEEQRAAGRDPVGAW